MSPALSRFLRVAALRGVRLASSAALLLALATALPTAPLSAQSSVGAGATLREPLNSERIERLFGSYGVEVLSSDDTTRVANLFSAENGARTCRTFAVSRYPASIAPAFAAEHEEIVAGGSIGAVFAKHGWTVKKTHLYFGEVQAWPKLAALMRITPGDALAEDVYVLDIVKGAMQFEYATIVEIHHPDYLHRADLPRLYGRADSGGRDELVRTAVATAAARAAR